MFLGEIIDFQTKHEENLLNKCSEHKEIILSAPTGSGKTVLVSRFIDDYTERREIFYPDLSLPEQPDCPIGKYGQMRLDFLKKHRRGTYTTLLMTFKLNAYLAEIDREARSQVEFLTAELAKKRGIDENLKANNTLMWVREMNNCKASAEEFVLRKVVYN